MNRPLFFLLCFFYTHSVVAQQLSIKGDVSFLSDAPLEMITAKSNKLSGIIDPDKGTFAFSIPLKSFEGFNSALQKEHFHENYLETSTYPNLTYSGKILDKIDLNSDGTFEIRSKGYFSIHGVKRERILKNTIRIKGKKIYLESQFTILLDEYNIIIPKIVNKKIAEEINITVKGEGMLP